MIPSSRSRQKSHVSDEGASKGVVSHLSCEDRWERALGQLKEKGILFTDDERGSASKREILLEVLMVVRGAEQASQEKRWKWKNRKGETIIVRDVFAKMAVWIEKFKNIGDTIVQYDPGHAALPWAAARFVLQVALNDIQTNGAILEGLELVFHLITKFEVVEQLYLRKSSSVYAQLDDCIVSLYGAILEYLLDARQYFAQKKTIRIVKSVFQLEDMRTKHVSNIQARAKKVDEYVHLIADEMADQTSSILKTALSDLDEPIRRMCSHISEIEDKLKENERLRIFEWLTSIEYSNHHRTKTKMLLADSGKWLLRKKEFQNWMASSNSSILWLHGIPGSGKSMLVAHVIEYIKNRNARELSPAPLAYFYCSRNATEPERADPVELLRCILEQLSCSEEDLPIRLPVVEAYQLRRKEARGRNPGKLDLEDTVKVVLDLLESNPATIVIDALDECDPTRRQELLNSLQTIVKESDNVVKIFVSSRDDHDLVHRLSRSTNLYIDASQNMEDITKFVNSRVRTAIRQEKILCGQVPTKLRDEIITTLIEKAKGMFRLVSLHIESLCDPTRVKTKANVLHVLENLPPDLEKSYDYILAQISSSQKPNPEIASRVFKWLLSAREQLSSQTFILAVCSGMEDVGLITQFDVLSVCSNLVLYDEDFDTFQFAHLSVVEYLERRNEYSPAAANAFCAEQCLSWIVNRGDSSFTSPDFNVPIARPQYTTSRKGKKRTQDTEDFYRSSALSQALFVSVVQSFSTHADMEWGEYARLAGRFRSEGRLQTLLNGFLLPLHANNVSASDSFDLWMDRIDIGPKRDEYKFIKNWQRNPLFAACAFDLSEIVAALLKDIPDGLDMQTDWGYNCLVIAADCNSVATTEVLIAESRRCKLSTTIWQRPLYGAACNVHFEVVHAILSYVGRSFFPQFYLLDFVSRPFAAKAVQQDYEKTLLLLLDNGSELRLTEDVLLEMFRNKFHDGKSIAKTLLLSGKPIEITRRLVNSSYINPYCGREMMDGLLSANETTSVTADAFIDLLSSAAWPKMDAPRMALLGKRKEHKSFKIHAGSIRPSFQRGVQLAYIAQAAIAKLIDLRRGLSDVLLDQAGDNVELTWEHLLLLEGVEKRFECVECILRSQPEMSQTAINMLLASWNVGVVEALLKFRKITVSKDVIKCTAWNVEYGEKILQALLNKELEEMCL